MKQKAVLLILAAMSTPLFAVSNQNLQQQLSQLEKENKAMQAQLNRLQSQMASQARQNSRAVRRSTVTTTQKITTKTVSQTSGEFHDSHLKIHAPQNQDSHPESVGFYPTALIADNQIVTYIAGTPVVTSPYLGDRPAFDGSDYIVNISSINRDIRLMQQRRRLYDAYKNIGYPIPQVPIVALSGKTEPVANYYRPFQGSSVGDLNLGSSELDVAAALNSYVEGYIGIAYDDSPLTDWGQRVSNSSFNLNLGFVNIGNLDETPFYFTAGQLFAPYGRYASAMISTPLTQALARTKTRPFILGYKSQTDTGPFAAGYIFRSDTTLGRAAVGGVNLGYVFQQGDATGEIGGGIIGNLADSQGMQNTGSAPLTTFGGFASPTNGNENVGKVHGINAHANISYDRYNINLEWVGASTAFRPQDLSFNGYGAKPQAGQVEGGVTFMVLDKPSSLAFGYQYSRQSLALNLPKHRVSGVFNISIWKDTVESIEYRHDVDYRYGDFANGANAPGLLNGNTLATGGASDSLIAQVGVYF